MNSHTLTWVVFILLAFVTQAESVYPPPLGITVKGVVTEVIDGDTLHVRPDVPVVSVRLEGCRAPEKNTRRGKKAAEELTEYIKGEKVIVHLKFLENQRTGETRQLGSAWSLNRWVGQVWADKAKSKSLSEWQITRGNAAKQLEEGKDWGE